MNICFDIFIEKPSLKDAVLNKPSVEAIFDAAVLAIENNLQHLKSEIEAEEKLKPTWKAGIVFNLLPEAQNQGHFIGTWGYSDELSDKILDSFDEAKVLAILDLFAGAGDDLSATLN